MGIFWIGQADDPAPVRRDELSYATPAQRDDGVQLFHHNNIIKAFGNAASIVLSTFLSVFLFDFVITSNYICGCVLVIIAIVMYSSGQKK